MTLLMVRQMITASLLGVAVAVAMLATVQRRMIYPIGYDNAPTPAAPTGFSTLRRPTPSGNMLVWRHEGRPDRPVLVFLHGNATDIAGTAYVTRSFMDAGWTVVAPEYPGYAGNAGSPSEAGLFDAARAGWSVAVDGRSASDVLIVGNSIGSGPAVALAAETRPRGLAIVSGIASLPQVVRDRLPFIPDFLVWDRFYNAAKLSTVKVPVLVIHGDADDVVATWQGEALAQSAHTSLIRRAGGHEIIVRRDVQDLIRHRFQTR